MTHRDRAGDRSGQRAGRREAAGDAGHRQGFPTPSGGSPAAGSPARPEQRLPKAFGLRMALRRGGRRPAWLTMPWHRRTTRVLAESLGKPSLWVIINAPWYYLSARKRRGERDEKGWRGICRALPEVG